MSINDLIAPIADANCDKILVARRALATGNTDGPGNYRIIKLRLGEQEIAFTNASGVWASNA